MNNLYLHITYLKMCKCTFIYQGLKNIKTKKKETIIEQRIFKKLLLYKD